MVNDFVMPIDRRGVLTLLGAGMAGGPLAGCLVEAPSRNYSDGTGGDGGGTPPGNSNPDVDDETVDELVRENRRFAFELYGRLVEGDPAGNLFCSPHSISIALAMTYAGARGETRDRMAETLRFTLGDDVHAAIAALAGELESRSGADDDDGDAFELAIANAIWGQAEYPFRHDFLERIETNYGAGVETVDFRANPDGARRTINDWVESQTAGKIEELLPSGSITELARLVLTNAIYFRASWDRPFEEASTAEATFTALDGTETSVPMMRQSESFPYAAVEGHQLIELPYVGDAVGMVILLPAPGEFESFEASLDGERFATLLDELDRKEGEIVLPRFEYNTGFGLGDVLSSMGMATAFDPDEADFSGIADIEATGEPLFIHDVYHDAAVSVDEEGTEAAAATGVVVGTDSAPMDPFEMVVDRPFLFAIRDRPTGTLLFLGRVVDAGAAQ